MLAGADFGNSSAGVWLLADGALGTDDIGAGLANTESGSDRCIEEGRHCMVMTLGAGSKTLVWGVSCGEVAVVRERSVIIIGESSHE